MITYRRPDTGAIVGCYHGLGTTWIVATRKANGALQRIKSPSMPPCRSAVKCQANLDAYAATKHWLAVEKQQEPTQ